MEARQIVYALAIVWLALFAGSFLALQMAEETATPSAQILNRIATFLTWQGGALVAAAVAALVAYRAAARGTEKVKAAGYLPLALSVFVLVSFIAIVAYRVFVVPALT